MANTSIGKKFEGVFQKDWERCFPDGLILRLPDQMTGYKDTSANPCDYVCFEGGELFLIECKEHKKISIPFTAIPQYERQLKYIGKKNVHAGVVVWFSEKDTVIWCPIEEMKKIVDDGHKSISLAFLDKKMYNISVLPSTKKRVFMETDYKALLEACK